MYIFVSIHKVPSDARAFIQVCYDIQSYENAALLTMNLVKNTMDSFDPILDSVKILGTIQNEDIIKVFV